MQVVDARLVLDPPVGVGVAGVGGAALGHDQRRQRRPVAGPEGDQPLAHRVGDDRPAEVGLGVAHEVVEREEHLGVLRRGPDPHRHEVVDAVEVQRLADRGEVALLDQALDQRLQVGRVAPQQHGLEEHPVPQRVEELGGPDVGLVLGRRPHRRVVVGAPHALRPRRAQRDRPASVGEQQVVGDVQRVEHQLPPRGVDADGVPEHRGDVGLVDRHPVGDAIGETLGHDRGVLLEPVDGAAVEPAAVVLERLGQVPVVERGHRVDPGGQQLVDEPVVEVQARGVDGSATVGLDPRPGDGEAVVPGAELLHQPDVLDVAVVVTRGGRARGAVPHHAGGGGEGVPDRRPAALCRTLDLVRRGGRADPEAGWQRQGGSVGHGVHHADEAAPAQDFAQEPPRSRKRLLDAYPRDLSVRRSSSGRSA